MSKPQTYKVPEVKRSRTGNNLCQCLVPMHEGYIDAEMIEQGYSDDTHRFYTLGCGKHCSNRFAQGHDAKLKSELIRAYRDNVEMNIDTGGMLIGTDAMNMARQLGWEHFLVPGKPKTRRQVREINDALIAKATDEIGQGIHEGDTVEFKWRGRQQQATVETILEGGDVVVTWISTASGKTQTTTKSAKDVVTV